MRNLLKLASQTVDGLRALPKIGQILTEKSDEQALAKRVNEVELRLESALDVYRAALTESKARIATLVESDGRLRIEIERLSTELSVARSATVDWRREHGHLKTQFDTVAAEYTRADAALQSANLEIARLRADLDAVSEIVA